MAGKKLKELPYYERPDLTPYLIHLTKKFSQKTALENLISIFQDGVIKGTDSFIKNAAHGSEVKAACFMDVPFTALKYVCSPKNAERYQPYGVVVQKRGVYQQGGRPVLYLSDTECGTLRISLKQLWRVVSLEYDKKEDTWIDWQHEREWRCPKEFKLKKASCIALVKSVKDVEELEARIDEMHNQFRCLPITIIPLEVICQGFGS